MGPLEPRLRDSERRVLDLIRRGEPIRRAALAAQTSLSQPTVHRIVTTLEGHGLVRRGRVVAHGPGKPSPELWLDRRRVRSLGVSVTTDAISLCLVDLGGTPVQQAQVTGRSTDAAAALDLIADEADHLLGADGDELVTLVGVCLALPAYFLDATQVSPPAPLRDWGGRDLAAELARRFPVPCHLENSATTGAIGESLVGVGRWASTFVYLSFNHGFGAGIVIDGQPYRGANGNAGEISRLFTDAESGHRPALAGLLAQLRTHGVDVDGVQALRERFDPDWPGVADWVELVAPQLNRAIWACSAVVDPEAIVLGGELPAALARLLLARIEPHATRHHRSHRAIPTPVMVASELPAGGSALGAATVPLKATLLP